MQVIACPTALTYLKEPAQTRLKFAASLMTAQQTMAEPAIASPQDFAKVWAIRAHRTMYVPKATGFVARRPPRHHARPAMARDLVALNADTSPL